MTRPATVVSGRTTAPDWLPGCGEITGIVGSLLDADSSQPIVQRVRDALAPGGGYVTKQLPLYTRTPPRSIRDRWDRARQLLARLLRPPSARFNTFWFDGKAGRASASVVTVNNNTITSVGTARVKTFGAAAGIVPECGWHPCGKRLRLATRRPVRTVHGRRDVQ